MDEVYTIEAIRAVLLNQGVVPQYLLDAYDLDHPDALTAKGREVDESEYLFQLLVLIIAKAQGVSEPGTAFVEFVRKDTASWHKWVILAKNYRKWQIELNSVKATSVPVTEQDVF